jgi:hypothetical protein
LSVFIAIVLVVGFAGVIGNQMSLLRRNEQLQLTMDEINRKLRNQN